MSNYARKAMIRKLAANFTQAQLDTLNRYPEFTDACFSSQGGDLLQLLEMAKSILAKEAQPKFTHPPVAQPENGHA